MSTQPNTAQHTPGPWRIGAHDSCVPNSIIAGHYELVADVAGMPGAADHDANARLIAAAPELLAELEAEEANLTALVVIARNLPESGDRSALVDVMTARLARVRAALAKATGGEG